MRRDFPLQMNISRVLGLALVYLGMASSSPASEIAWRSDLSAASAEAKASGKLVWAQITAPWCGACQKMDRDTFTDERVKSVASQYVAVKLRSESSLELAARHGMDSLPATLLLRPDGTLVDRVQGYVEPLWFANFLGAHSSKGTPPKKVVQAQPPRQSETAETARPRPRRSFAKNDQGFALGGYCPVCLVDGHTLIAGFSGVTIAFEGKRYRFASERMAERFRQNPRRYAPVNGGACAVSLVDRGERKSGRAQLGMIHEGHLYLFATKADRLAFAKDPERYERVGHYERSVCSDCWATRRLSRRELGQGRLVGLEESSPVRLALDTDTASKAR